FNQQILTGRSLQPLHYEIFTANYVSLLALFLMVYVLRRGSKEAYEPIPGRILALFTVAVFGWGIVQTTGAANSKVAQTRLEDDAMPVLKWMAAEGKKAGFAGADSDNPRAVVFASVPLLAETLPTGAPQAQLFAAHMLYYSGAGPEEMRER